MLSLNFTDIILRSRLQLGVKDHFFRLSRGGSRRLLLIVTLKCRANFRQLYQVQAVELFGVIQLVFMEAQDGIIELFNSVKVMQVYLCFSFTQTDLCLGGLSAFLGIVAREFAPVTFCGGHGLLLLGIWDL